MKEAFTMAAALALALVVGRAELAFADPPLLDDFEDGDYTSNPTWTVENPAGHAEVLLDPVRSDNLVLGGYGDRAAHRCLATGVNHPWDGFELVFEFAADEPDYGTSVGLASTDFGFRARLRADLPGPARFQIYKSKGPTYAETTIPGNHPVDQWWTIRVYHDPALDLVKGSVAVASVGSPLAQVEFVPPLNLGSANPIPEVFVVLQGFPWQHVDNIALGTIPEPAALSLLGVGAAGVLWRRRHGVRRP